MHYRYRGAKKSSLRQSYVSKIFQRWRSDGQPGKLSKNDWLAIETAKKQRQKEQDETHKQAALKSQSIWFRASYADANNGYCARKKIQPHGAKVGFNGALIIPLYDASGKLANLQFIQPDGTKRFLSGGRKAGCFWTIGEVTDKILIAEGYATGCSLFENQGIFTVVSFDAGNLSAVAQIIRSQNPNAKIVICGDNDVSSIGQRSANAAALACAGKVLIPPMPGMDWNDYLVSEVV